MVKKIVIDTEAISLLAEEFDCSNVTVYQALRHMNNSYRSVQIRARAIELGGQEVVIPELKRQ